MTESLPPVPPQIARQRRIQEKQFNKALKRLASGSGWRHARESLFRDHCGWFVEVQSIIHRNKPHTIVRLHAKPMALDPLYWNIVGLNENRKAPLSLRAHGAWVCRTPAIEEAEFADDERTPEDLAQETLAWADARLPLIDELSADTFLDLLRHGDCWQRETALITALILFGKEAEAREQIEKAASGRTPAVAVIAAMSGNSTASFPREARAWLDRDVLRPIGQ